MSKRKKIRKGERYREEEKIKIETTEKQEEN